MLCFLYGPGEPGRYAAFDHKRKTRMGSKNLTFALVGLLIGSFLTMSCVMIADSGRWISNKDLELRTLRRDLQTANAAVLDAKSFLNFFRLSDTDDFTPTDYKRHIHILKTKFTGKFPEWAKMQASTQKDDAAE